MMSIPAVRFGPPVRLIDEIDRDRLLDRLRHRWDYRVTVLVGGAGFGKSTLLAQALRDNAVDPRGIDVWYACVPGDEDSRQLGRGLAEALDTAGENTDVVGPDVLAQLAEALGRYSPIDVSLILDDAERLRRGSSGADLLDQLVRRLPANAHVVLASRGQPPAALARLRAADQLLQIDEVELGFDDRETALLAARLGRSAASLDTLGGWPALVRLALTVQSEVAFTFAREEVLSRLGRAERRAVFTLANLGYASEGVVNHIVGSEVDLRDLCTRVPLTTRSEQGLYSAHTLWGATSARMLDPAETAELRARLIDHLIQAGDVARAGAVALAHQDHEALASVAVELVTRTVSVLPVDTARPWLEVLQRHQPGRAETQLLGAAIRQATDFSDRTVDDDIDRAANGFRCNLDPAGEAAALAVGTVGAHSRHDVPRIVALATRAHAIPGSFTQPVVTLAVHSMAAVAAEMAGHPEQAVAELRKAQPERVPAGVATAAYRFLMHCLLVTGQAEEAVAVAGRLQGLGHQQGASLLAFACWMAGDPTAFLALDASVRPDGSMCSDGCLRSEGGTRAGTGLTSRDEFVRRPTMAQALAGLGRAEELAYLAAGSRTVHTGTHPYPTDPHHAAPVQNARDGVLAAVTQAFALVVQHDDKGAAQVIADAWREHHNSPVVEHHLRRFLPLVYVLNPSLRLRWDQAQVGPSHVRRRTICRLLLDLRAGRRVEVTALDPAQVLTVLPLPWSVELACLLHARGLGVGIALASWLVDAVAERTHGELRRLAAQGASARPGSRMAAGRSPKVSKAAADLLKCLPSVPVAQLTISVLGPLQVRFDGESVSSAALRRARVRTLLALLVVHRTLTRERAIDLLWPDLDPADGARNLRVTLTYLRQLLEPDRPRGEASFHLRTDGTALSLHASDRLSVDLWELQGKCEEASEHRKQAQTDQAVEALTMATSWWRGEPLGDLAQVYDQEPAIERARLLQLGALLEVGELRLTRGETGDALLAADRALNLDPYSERAHRLAMSAALHSHDHVRAGVVADRLILMLSELGVEPAPATRILLRQHHARAGVSDQATGRRSLAPR